MQFSKRTFALALLAFSAVGAGSALVVEGLSDGDSRQVEKRYIERIRVATPSGTDSTSADGQSWTRTIDPDSVAVAVPELESGLGVVPGLVEVAGVVQWSRDEFRIDGRELDMGPESWMKRTLAAGDLNGDGITSDWWSEVSAMVGRSIVVLGDTDDDDIDVFEIDGILLRPLFSEIAPWSDDWNGGGLPEPIEEALRNGLSAEEAVRIALEQVPGVVTDVQIDINDGHPYWEIDVRTPAGDVYDVEIDALTGRTVEIDQN